MVPAGTSRRTLAFLRDGASIGRTPMKFKFPDRVAAIEFVNYLASPEEFSMNGIVHGDVVDVPGVEPDGCSPGFLHQLEAAAETLDGARLPADSNEGDRFKVFWLDRVHRSWRRRRYRRH
jgi:hypothetical protein